MKKPYNNNKSKISAPAWNEKFHLLDGSYSIPDIQDIIKNIIKKHKTVTDNLAITFSS